MLYTIFVDSNHYRSPVIDSVYVASIVGGLRDGGLENRIDINHQPRSWQGVFRDPLKISFPKFSKQDEDRPIPDISEFQGRLFLNSKAYDALCSIIEGDGEFLPVTYENGDGFIFTPLRIADAVDRMLSKKNEWADLEHLAFHEDRLCGWALFRCEYTAFMRLYCTDRLVSSIQDAELKGLYITNDLGNIYPENGISATTLNS